MKQQINPIDFFKKHPELNVKKDLINKLIIEAKRVRGRAYVPYSQYKVGVSLLCNSGNIYSGCNIENVSYTPTIHAEQAAIVRAVTAGETKSGRKFIKALVVVHDGNSIPCGLCRQSI